MEGAAAFKRKARFRMTALHFTAIAAANVRPNMVTYRNGHPTIIEFIERAGSTVVLFLDSDEWVEFNETQAVVVAKPFVPFKVSFP
jgi:hypothetical protein